MPASYRQYCPVSRSAEVLTGRWTPLVVRNLLFGATTFNDLHRGVPGMSRSLLSRRLDELRRAGVIETEPKPRGRGHRYILTDAGRDLWETIAAMARWGHRWMELGPEHTDPGVALWIWSHYTFVPPEVDHPVVAEFTFPEEPPDRRRYWIIVEPGGLELCDSDPGLEVDVRVTAASDAFTRWQAGRAEWRDVIRSGAIKVTGDRALARAIPTWNDRTRTGEPDAATAP